MKSKTFNLIMAPSTSTSNKMSLVFLPMLLLWQEFKNPQLSGQQFLHSYLFAFFNAFPTGLLFKTGDVSLGVCRFLFFLDDGLSGAV